LGKHLVRDRLSTLSLEPLELSHKEEDSIVSIASISRNKLYKNDTNSVNRFKRASNYDYNVHEDEDEIVKENTQQSVRNQNTQKDKPKRKLLKVIKRKPKLLSRDIILNRSSNSSSDISADKLDQVKPSLVTKSTRKRIAITRKKTIKSGEVTPSTIEVEFAGSIAPAKRIKKILKTKKRIINEKQEPDYDDEFQAKSQAPSIPTPVTVPPDPIIYTTETQIYDTITTTTTRKRTYTYVVTRVNDQESIVMSSTAVKDHVAPVTQTITRTISLTLTIPQLQQLQTRSPV
jgi:hypothetical protein